MADITTDVLIIGTGPAGSATAALLSSYGVNNLIINRYRWLANTPRAHITNQRCMEVLRDLGREVEDEAYMFATHQDLMGENIFCESLAGEEIGRLKAWGNHPLSKAEHLMSSPTKMNDLPQTYMEPLLFKTACARGAQAPCRISNGRNCRTRAAMRSASNSTPPKPRRSAPVIQAPRPVHESAPSTALKCSPITPTPSRAPMWWSWRSSRRR